MGWKDGTHFYGGQPYASEVTVRDLEGNVLRTEAANNEECDAPNAQVPRLGRKAENSKRQREFISGSKVG